jgi:hypothetical protein
VAKRTYVSCVVVASVVPMKHIDRDTLFLFLERKEIGLIKNRYMCNRQLMHAIFFYFICSI